MKHYQYIGVLMLISWLIIDIITPVTAKSLPHQNPHNNPIRNARLQAPESHTSVQLSHQKTKDLLQPSNKPARSLSANVQQTAVTTRPHLNNIEYDLRLRQLMEELVANSRIESQYYAVHALLPLELRDTYQQHLEAIGATATAATVSTADKPDYTHNNEITTSNDRENYQQHEIQHHKDNKDFVHNSSFFTPANELLLLDRRNTTLNKDTTDTPQFQKFSPSSLSASTSSSSSLNSSAGPSFSAASLKDTLLDYVLLEYMTKTKQNLTKIFDSSRVGGSSSVALANSQRIRQQLEFLQKNAEKFKKFQQVEERTKNASAVQEWDILKDIDAIQQSALKEQHWVAVDDAHNKELGKEISTVEKENQKSENSENGTNSSSYAQIQPNTSTLEEFSTKWNQDDKDVKTSENSGNWRNSSASQNYSSANKETQTQILENLPLFENSFHLGQRYNNSVLESDLSLKRSNESTLLLDPISKNMGIHALTASFKMEINLKPKNSTTYLYVPVSVVQNENDFPQNVETTTISELSGIREDVQNHTMTRNETENITTEYEIHTTTETEMATDYSAVARVEDLPNTDNYDNITGMEKDSNETTLYIVSGNLTSPKEPVISKIDGSLNTIHHADKEFELENTTTIETGVGNNISAFYLEEQLKVPSTTTNPKTAAENKAQSNSPPLPLMSKRLDETTDIIPHEETTLSHVGLLATTQGIPIQNLDVNNLNENRKKIIGETTIEPQIPSETKTQAPEYQQEAANGSTYNNQPGSTSEIPEFLNVTGPYSSVDNQLQTTSLMQQKILETKHISNPSSHETKSMTEKVPIGVIDNPLSILESSTIAIPDRREPEANVVIPDIFDRFEVNANNSFDQSSTELPSSLTNSMGTEMEASKYLPFSEMLNLTNTKTLEPDIYNTDNELTTEWPSATTIFPDSTTNLAASDEEEIITKLPGDTSNSWPSDAPSRMEDATDNAYDDKTPELSVEPPIADTTLASEEVTTETSPYDTTENPLLNEANVLITELPIIETTVRPKESTASTVDYDDTVAKPFKKVYQLGTKEMPYFTLTPINKPSSNISTTTELPNTGNNLTRDEATDLLKLTSKEIQMSIQTPSEGLINNSDITTELPIAGESTDTTELLSVSTQIPTKESNINIKVRTVSPFADLNFTTEIPTNTPKSTKNLMPISTQFHTEEPIANSDTTPGMSVTGSYLTGQESVTIPKISEEVLATLTQSQAAALTTDHVITTDLPTNTIKFSREDTAESSLMPPIENSINKSQILAKMPNADIYSTAQQSTDNPKTTTELMSGSTQINTEDSTTEFPSTNAISTRPEISYTPLTTTKVQQSFAQFPNQHSIHKNELTTELPITDLDFTRRESAYNPNQLMTALTQIPTEVSQIIGVMTTELPTIGTKFATDKSITTTEVMPHITITQIPKEDTNIENYIATESSTTETYLRRQESKNIPKPIVSSNTFPKLTILSLATKEKELNTKLPTSKINLFDTDTPSPAGDRNKEPTDTSSEKNYLLPDIQTKSKVVLPISKINIMEEEITPVSETPHVLVGNQSDILSKMSECKENDMAQKELDDEAVFQFVLKNKNSQSGNSVLAGLIVAETQPERLKYEESAEISQGLFLKKLPTENVKSTQSVDITHAIKSESSQSNKLIPDKMLVTELSTENPKSIQSAVSVNAVKSELPTENPESIQSAVSINAIKLDTDQTNKLNTEDSTVSTNVTKSELSQTTNPNADRQVALELPFENVKSKQSTASPNATKSDTNIINNLISDRLPVSELPTGNLKSELSATTISDFGIRDNIKNFAILHPLQSKMESLKDKLDNTKNFSTLVHKISGNILPSNVPEVFKPNLNLPDVEVFLQGVTSQEVNSIKDNVGYPLGYLKKHAVFDPTSSTENILMAESLNVKETFMNSIESTTDVAHKNEAQAAVKSPDYESMDSLTLSPEIYKVLLENDNLLQTNFHEFDIDKLMAAKAEEELTEHPRDELDVEGFYQNKPSTEIAWLQLQPSSRVPSIEDKKLPVSNETTLTQPFSTFAEQLPNAAKLEIVKPQAAPESRLAELITIIGNSLQATSGSNTKSQHVASGVTRQCPDNNNKQQQQQEQQHQGPKVHDDGTAALVNCSSATGQTMQLTTFPSTPSTALTAAGATLAWRTASQNETENVQMLAISKTVENQKDNKRKWTTFKNNHLNNGSLTKANDNEDAQIPEIKKDNANNHSPDEDEVEHEDDDEGVQEVVAANKSSINDKDIRLESKVRPDIVLATEINATNNTPVVAGQDNDGHVLDRTNNAQYTNNAFKISTATKTMTTIEDGSVGAEGGLNEMSTIETKLLDISKDNRNDMTITGLKKGGHNTQPILYKAVNDDATTIGLKKDYTQKGNEHEMTQGNNKDAVIETDDYENGVDQYITIFPSSSSSDETEQDEVISANIEALDAVAQEVEQLSTLTDTFLNTQSFPDVTPYNSNLYYKSHRSRKKKQKLKSIHASVNPHPTEEITTTNWWHSLPYAEIRKFLNSISDSVESW